MNVNLRNLTSAQLREAANIKERLQVLHARYDQLISEIQADASSLRPARRGFKLVDQAVARKRTRRRAVQGQGTRSRVKSLSGTRAVNGSASEGTRAVSSEAGQLEGVPENRLVLKQPSPAASAPEASRPEWSDDAVLTSIVKVIRENPEKIPRLEKLGIPQRRSQIRRVFALLPLLSEVSSQILGESLWSLGTNLTNDDSIREPLSRLHFKTIGDLLSNGSDIRIHFNRRGQLLLCAKLWDMTKGAQTNALVPAALPAAA